jgi:hypothetical protein
VECDICGEPVPPFGAEAWLAAHRWHSHQLPRRLSCEPCRTGAIVSTLKDVAGWSWMHGRCGLVEDEPLPQQLRWGRSPWVRVH